MDLPFALVGAMVAEGEALDDQAALGRSVVLRTMSWSTATVCGWMASKSASRGVVRRSPLFADADLRFRTML
jgi:hypothetical protein